MAVGAAHGCSRQAQSRWFMSRREGPPRFGLALGPSVMICSVEYLVEGESVVTREFAHRLASTNQPKRLAHQAC